jgi:hypothetical protein
MSESNTLQFRITSLVEDGSFQLCEEFNKFVTSIAQDRIWHKDVLVAVVSNGLVCGSLAYDSDVEDEWFATFVLWKFSESQSRACIRHCSPM